MGEDRVTDSQDGFVPPPTKMHRRRWWRRIVALSVVAAVVIAGAVWALNKVLDTCGSLDSGVHEIDDDCVGVTNGSYEFHPELADIEGKIKKENERVRADKRGYVSIALLDPLTPTDSSALPPDAIRNRLEGAYTALRRINTDRTTGNLNPQIELLLANEGSTDGQWEAVRDRLDELSDAETHPLVAVVGLGVSTARTERHLKDLSTRGIPMIGAVLTADTFEYDKVPGLIKTSPSNRHYVAALHSALTHTGLDSAILVRDTNSDAGFDLYTKTLEDDFEKEMRDVLDHATQQFTGKSATTKSATGLFDSVQANICAAAAEKRKLAVLYAGREIDFGDFVDALQNRGCNRTPLTILTAGVELGKVLKGKDLRDANLTVLNAATVDPEGWSHKVAGTPEFFKGFHDAFVDDQHFAPDDLSDGGAIMMHDAVMVAARAIRLAAPHGSASRLTVHEVNTQLLNINTNTKVQGASGTLWFSKQPSGRGTGIPMDKPIPVLQYPSPDTSLPSVQAGPLCSVVETEETISCK